MLRTFFFYLIFYPWTLIATVLALFLTFFWPEKTPAVIQFWGRSCLVLAGIKIQTRGTEHIPRNGPAIYVSNHQSNFDIPIIYTGLPVRFSWMAKQELFKVPLFGLAMRRSGIIPIDRSNRRTTMRSIMAAAQRIKEGTSVVIFPEGTRTPNGQLQKFKKGALLLAAKAQVPVVPIAIHGSYQLQPRDCWKINHGTPQIEFFPPITTEGLKSSDINTLTDRIHQLIAGSLQKVSADAS